MTDYPETVDVALVLYPFLSVREFMIALCDDLHIQRPAETTLGPWYDVCRPGCCENVRLGFKPAVAGMAP